MSGELGGADAAADHKSAFTSGNYNFYLLAIVTSQCSICGNICGVQAAANLDLLEKVYFKDNFSIEAN